MPTTPDKNIVEVWLAAEAVQTPACPVLGAVKSCTDAKMVLNEDALLRKLRQLCEAPPEADDNVPH
jgi:hypothetical protein